jgi:hypothetical protein
MRPAQDDSFDIAISITANYFSQMRHGKCRFGMSSTASRPSFSHSVVVHPWSGFERHNPKTAKSVLFVQAFSFKSLSGGVYRRKSCRSSPNFRPFCQTFLAFPLTLSQAKKRFRFQYESHSMADCQVRLCRVTAHRPAVGEVVG